jgi:hypothetical protein
MCIHAAAYIFIEWSSFHLKWFWIFFSKDLSKTQIWKMKKDFLYSLPVSGLAQPLLPRGPHSPPSPFLFLLRPSTSAAHFVARVDIQRRAPPPPCLSR